MEIIWHLYGGLYFISSRTSAFFGNNILPEKSLYLQEMNIITCMQRGRKLEIFKLPRGDFKSTKIIGLNILRGFE